MVGVMANPELSGEDWVQSQRTAIREIMYLYSGDTGFLGRHSSFFKARLGRLSQANQSAHSDCLVILCQVSVEHFQRLYHLKAFI